MTKSKFKGICSAVTQGPMADGFGFVVECFYRTIIDWNLKAAEDVFLAAADHPIIQAKSRMGSNLECVAHQNH
jgi:hypothetical protein